jgi:hypothetical protein
VKYVRRPSPALIIACIALFISLGGVSYGLASGSIDSRELKNNTVRSKDVRNNTLRTFDIRNNEVRGFDIRNSTVQGRDVALNTLTGADINEAGLSKVPSAALADSATNATNAGNAATVGGMTVRKFFAKPAPGTAAAEVFRGDSFVLRAGCTAGNEAQLFVDPVAGAPATNVHAEASGPHTVGGPLTPATPLLDTPSGTGIATLSTTAGGVASIVYSGQEAPAFTGENVCAVRGTVTSG